MKNSRKVWLGGLALVAVAALPLTAFASHGKAGLWKITTSMHMAGMQMPQLSAQQMAQMKAMGIHMPTDNTVTVQHCMTQAEVNADTPPDNQRQDSGCKMTNVKVVAHTMTADMVCTGQMKGQGHFNVTYDSPEHYKGQTAFKGTMEGRPADMTNSFEGTWVSASCGNVHR